MCQRETLSLTQFRSMCRFANRGGVGDRRRPASKLLGIGNNFGSAHPSSTCKLRMHIIRFIVQHSGNALCDRTFTSVAVTRSESLEDVAALQVWEQEPRQLAGWYPRQTCVRVNNKATQYYWKGVKDYSMVRPGQLACSLHLGSQRSCRRHLPLVTVQLLITLYCLLQVRALPLYSSHNSVSLTYVIVSLLPYVCC